MIGQEIKDNTNERFIHLLLKEYFETIDFKTVEIPSFLKDMLGNEKISNLETHYEVSHQFGRIDLLLEIELENNEQRLVIIEVKNEPINYKHALQCYNYKKGILEFTNCNENQIHCIVIGTMFSNYSNELYKDKVETAIVEICPFKGIKIYTYEEIE